MHAIINRLENLLIKTQDYIASVSLIALENKQPEKWSKKEILGHLIDSGINNLKRFTEIQYEAKPYKIRSYNQDALVKANNYQQAEVNELVAFWLAVNARIIRVINLQTTKTLAYPIILSDGKISDLRFLMEDYVHHLEHHVNQIIKEGNA